MLKIATSLVVIVMVKLNLFFTGLVTGANMIEYMVGSYLHPGRHSVYLYEFETVGYTTTMIVLTMVIFIVVSLIMRKRS